MTAITHRPQWDASSTPAYRIAALLLGVGTLHFVAPKQFDGIIPVELPGPARFYTYASGVAELVIGALLLPLRTRRSGGVGGGRVVPGGVPWQRQHGPVVVGQAVADAHLRAGPAATANSDDHRRAQGRPQLLSGLSQHRGQLAMVRQRIRYDRLPGSHVVKSRAHQ